MKMELDDHKPATFILQQYCGEVEAVRPCLAITGTVDRRADTLLVHYHVSGDVHELYVPRQKVIETGNRRHGLWKDTCFECFIGVKGCTRYWEINLSPDGGWNVYRFNGYRQGMAEETAFRALPCTFVETKDDLWLGLNVDLSPILREDHPLELGISCVLKHHDGGTTLWSLCHPGSRADFHHRAGFVLAM